MTAIINEFSTENPFPDLVYLKIKAKPSEQNHSLIEKLSSGGQTNSVDLSLTLRFGRQTFRLKGGSIFVGLKRSLLRLNLINSRIPLEKMGLITVFSTAIEVERQQVKGRESEITASMSASIKTKDANQESDKVKYLASKVISRGTETEPVWIFEANPLESPYLLGQLTNEFLGNVEVNATPANVNASFTYFEHKDLHIEGEGLWPKNLSQNKLAIIERAFIRRFVEPKLPRYLSKVEVQL